MVQVHETNDEDMNGGGIPSRCFIRQKQQLIISAIIVASFSNTRI